MHSKEKIEIALVLDGDLFLLTADKKNTVKHKHDFKYNVIFKMFKTDKYLLKMMLMVKNIK